MINSNETKVLHLEDNDVGNEILEMKKSQVPSDPSAEVPTDEVLLQLKPCMEEPIQHVGQSQS
jgi:hypothetical protein